HLVHYPVCGGRRINIVAIVSDREQNMRWSTPGRREEVMRRFKATDWALAARELLEAPDEWLKWSLFDCAPLPSWGRGAMTLIGDAATLAKCLAEKDEAAPNALRCFERLRRKRTARVQRAARQAGGIFHLGGPLALARNLALTALGGEKLRERYDWLYDWRV
ncbi:MAG: monooxygenase, partial [Pseudorhodoplanes sp.]|nr:monooxygenase [Pseudorhodoplanes sp.]